MKITLYKFSKRVNSTAIPYGSSQKKEIDVQIYGDISIISPVFLITGATGSSPFTNLIGYNYCFVPDFNRYYSISDMSVVKGQWVITCSVDVLATYRNAIFGGTAYIKRANIDDASEPDTIHTTGHIAHISTEGATGMFGTMANYFIVGVRGVSNTYSLGNTTYYVMTQRQLQVFSNFLWSGSVTETSGVDKGDYVVSCRICKAILSDLPVGALESVKVGSANSGIEATPLDSSSNHCYSETTLLGVKVPKHPSYVGTTELPYRWLNNSPYASYTANFGIFGCMALPPSLVNSLQTINYRVRVYPLTGEATLFVYDGTGSVIMRHTVLAFPEMQLSSRTGTLASTVGGVVNSLTDTVAENVAKFCNSKTVSTEAWNKVGSSGFGQFMKNTFSMDIGKMGEDINSIKNALGNGASQELANIGKSVVNQNGIDIGGFTIGGLPNMSSTGGGGGLASTGDKPSITGFFNLIRDVVPSTEGRAVNKTDSIGNYSGFVEMSSTNIVPVGATETEKNNLYSLCNGVIYLE